MVKIIINIENDGIQQNYVLTTWDGNSKCREGFSKNHELPEHIKDYEDATGKMKEYYPDIQWKEVPMPEIPKEKTLEEIMAEQQQKVKDDYAKAKTTEEKIIFLEKMLNLK